MLAYEHARIPATSSLYFLLRRPTLRGLPDASCAAGAREEDRHGTRRGSRLVGSRGPKPDTCCRQCCLGRKPAGPIGAETVVSSRDAHTGNATSAYSPHQRLGPKGGALCVAFDPMTHVLHLFR